MGTGRRTQDAGHGTWAAVRGRGCGPRRREKARKLTCSDAVVKPRKPSLTIQMAQDGPSLGQRQRKQSKQAGLQLALPAAKPLHIGA